MKALLATFATAEAIAAAADRARNNGFPLLDALTPYPLPELLDRVGRTPAGVRVPMAAAGFGIAVAAYALQYWSAVHGYRFNAGGRPLNSWPVFLLVPVEVGILAAAVAGLVVFLVRCGLPRLRHPLFDVPGTARASHDRFLLLLDPLDAERQPALARLLLDAGAVSVSEAEA